MKCVFGRFREDSAGTGELFAALSRTLTGSFGGLERLYAESGDDFVTRRIFGLRVEGPGGCWFKEIARLFTVKYIRIVRETLYAHMHAVCKNWIEENLLNRKFG